MKIQRGYNLVEIAIVLVAALMMASWLAGNYYEFQQNQRVRETERRIDVIKDAIVEYAVAHRIQSFSVLNIQAPVSLYWQLSADRPYLPCPDITGDGIEDRFPLLAVPASREYELQFGAYRLLRPHECYREKGLVPWRTLDTPPADAWGNHFTYRVDVEFASSLLGFDELMGSDDSSNFVFATPVSMTVLADGQSVGMKTSILPDMMVSVSVSGSPGVVSLWGAEIINNYSPSLLCNKAPCSSGQVTNISYGVVASMSVTMRVSGYEHRLPVYVGYAQGNIISGLPVVIVSHGQNGYGAVSSQRESGTYGCHNFPIGHEDERQNAFSYAGPGGCSITVTNGSQQGFVVKDHSDVGGEEYDDVVGWMSTEELAARLTRRGVFPVAKLPPVGLEGK